VDAGRKSDGTRMGAVVFESVSKTFCNRPAWFNWIGCEHPGETHALQSISLTVASGSVLVLIGPNGSGKTTALKLISTILLPDRGRVLVQGVDTRSDSHAARRRVGFAVATERSFFPRLSARENLEFFAALDDVPRKERSRRVEAILDQIGLAGAADKLAMKFSTGMYQRLGLARALLKNPSILLLDEPTRSLDLASAMQFWKLVRGLAGQSTTVVVATHNFNEAVAVGDCVAVLNRGCIEGQKQISNATNVDQLRKFYFDQTGELSELPQVAAGGRR
jgi:ABC-2 type transport system ATP-binding protein